MVAPEMWERSGKRYTAREVIRSAVERLPDDDCPDENPDHAAVTWREVGMTLGGFREDLPKRENGKEYDYDALTAVLKSDSKIDPRDWESRGRKKLVKDFYGRLADALLELEEQARGEGAGSPEGRSESLDDEYIYSEQPSNKSGHSSANYSNYGLVNFVFHGPTSIRAKISKSKPVASAALVIMLIITSVTASANSRFFADDSETSTEAAESVPEGDVIVTLTSVLGAGALPVIMPQGLERETQELVDQLNGGSIELWDFQDSAISEGGYFRGSVEVHVEIEGNSDREVTIYDIRPVPEKKDLVDGSVLLHPGAGGADTRRMQFLLDEPEPLAREFVPGESINPRQRPYFFQSQRIGVGSGEKQTIVMKFIANWAAYDFEIAIDYELSGDRKTEVFANDLDGGRPFRVSGYHCVREPWGEWLESEGERVEDRVLVKNPWVYYEDQFVPISSEDYSAFCEGSLEVWTQGWSPDGEGTEDLIPETDLSSSLGDDLSCDESEFSHYVEYNYNTPESMDTYCRGGLAYVQAWGAGLSLHDRVDLLFQATEDGWSMLGGGSNSDGTFNEVSITGMGLDVSVVRELFPEMEISAERS
ncbi:hypothetical protein [Nocardiopsis lambiniae]|uniref:Uncharacterized protein n=1 Tax=Nocardiopsis lambiniae TaxID=3075539 RepID=A0ABU2MDZ3_9ACTN|nr:hypothetical protein [Nocardiopsis sp. DSM 44743]MDT0330885.1 hypothetical protein [Nocardiopsis sp. DSM 44743]